MVPAISENSFGEDKATAEAVRSALVAVVENLSIPELSSFQRLNAAMATLPEITKTKRGVASNVIKTSGLRHVILTVVAAFASTLIYYADNNYLNASVPDAFGLGITCFIGIVGIYVTYLGLTSRGKESRG